MPTNIGIEISPKLKLVSGIRNIEERTNKMLIDKRKNNIFSKVINGLLYIVII